MKTLKKSSQRDSDVIALQNKLNLARAKVHGNWPALSPDGVFGTATENAVKAFQVYSNICRDGIVGSKTWEKLEETCTNKHLIEPALCDIYFNTDSKLFMCRITNDPDEDFGEDELKIDQTDQPNAAAFDYSILIPTPEMRNFAMTTTNNMVNVIGAETAIFEAKVLSYNEIWHVTRTRGVAFSWQSRWNNFGAKAVRARDVKPLMNARNFSNTLTKAGFVMVGADILLSGEIKPSHGINAFMLGLSFTGYGAIIAAGWLVIDMGVGGYNYFAHGEWESLSDKIDKKLGKIEMYEGLY